MKNKLKPCPFCGNEPEMIHAVLEEYHSVDPEIICIECGYRIKAKNLAIAIADSPKENCKFLDRQTIQIWNTRPAEDAKDKEVERLKAALEDIKDRLLDRTCLNFGEAMVAQWLILKVSEILSQAPTEAIDIHENAYTPDTTIETKGVHDVSN